MYLVDVVSGLTPETCINKIESSVTEEEFVKDLRANSGLGVVKVVTLSSIDVSTTASPTPVPTILISANSNTSRSPKGLGNCYPHPASHSDRYPHTDIGYQTHHHTDNHTSTDTVPHTDPDHQSDPISDPYTHPHHSL